MTRILAGICFAAVFRPIVQSNFIVTRLRLRFLQTSRDERMSTPDRPTRRFLSSTLLVSSFHHIPARVFHQPTRPHRMGFCENGASAPGVVEISTMFIFLQNTKKLLVQILLLLVCPLGCRFHAVADHCISRPPEVCGTERDL